MSVIISQPRYLPVINYMQRIKNASIFVFLDNVQRQYLGVENRNKILINGKEKWLTIPVASSRKEIIKFSKIHGVKWIEDHKRMLFEAYKKHPCFTKSIIIDYFHDIEKTLTANDYSYSMTLIQLTLNACNIFDIQPSYEIASKLVGIKSGNENLLDICRKLDADIYISGTNGRSYGIKECLEKEGIKVYFNDFNYPYYKQKDSEIFIPWLSFFDMLFNVGYKQVKKAICEPLSLSKI